MKKKLSGLFVALGICQLGFSQFAQNYQPIAQNYTLQQEFTASYTDELLKAVADENALEETDAKDLYNNVYSAKKSLLTTGNVYFEDELTDYVRKVAKEVLKNNPELQSKIKIYVTRHSSANAMTLADGTILVNVGLLARLENEAQLALILAHEISHYEKKHTVKEYLKAKEVQIKERRSTEVSDFLLLRYSRETEQEADARGIQFVMASGYDALESIKAFQFLEDTIYKYPALVDQLIKTLSAETIKIDSSFFRSAVSKNESSKSNIVFGSLSEDLYTTHPDISKRIDALKEVLKLVGYKNDGKNKNLVLEDSKVEELKQKSLFEMIDNLYTQTDYNVSVYLCLGTMPSYPENVYLKKMLIKNLYWLSYYKELNNVEKTFNNSVIEITPSFASLNKFLLNVSHNDLKKICFEYTKKQFDSLKDDEEYFIYYAMISEIYLGKESASLLYNQHNLKFPNSKYYLYANNKTTK